MGRSQVGTLVNCPLLLSSQSSSRERGRSGGTSGSKFQNRRRTPRSPAASRTSLPTVLAQLPRPSTRMASPATRPSAPGSRSGLARAGPVHADVFRLRSSRNRSLALATRMKRWKAYM